MLYIVEEHLNLLANLGVTVQSSFNSRSTALMKRIGCKLLRWSRGCWIFDWLPRWSHVATVINNACNVHRWILIGHSDAFFVGFNLNRYNSFDQRLRLNRFTDESDHAAYPYALSEDRRSQFNRAIGRPMLRHVTSHLWSSIAIDRTVQIALCHLRAYKILKNQFLIRKIYYPEKFQKILKNSSKIQKNLEKNPKNPYKLENS